MDIRCAQPIRLGDNPINKLNHPRCFTAMVFVIEAFGLRRFALRGEDGEKIFEAG